MENKVKRSKTRELLITSFWDIYKKKERNVFVTDICEVAKCNRSTFYRYFKDTSEILVEIEDRVIARTREIFASELHSDDYSSLITDFAKFDAELFDYYSILLRQPSNSSFNRKLKVLIDEKTSNTPIFANLSGDEKKIFTELIVGIISSEYSLLKSGEVKTSPEEVTAFLRKLLLNGLSAIIDKDVLDKYKF